MRIDGCVALVTGANRGLGQSLVTALVERRAAKVYAAARRPEAVLVAGATPVKLDICDAGSVRLAARNCRDVSLLINNAAVLTKSSFIGAESMDNARREMETNYFGTLAMCRAFAGILKSQGGGTLVNILSIVSWFNTPFNASYGASKAAEWALTNGLRVELSRQKTLVVGVHLGHMDTEMSVAVEAPKLAPAQVAAQVLDAVEQNQIEVLADERTKRVKATLSRDHELIYPEIIRAWIDAAD